VKKIKLTLSILLFTWLTGAIAYSSSPIKSSSKGDFFHTFSSSLPQELSRAKKEGKFGLMLFFSTSHCPFCKRMKTTVFNQPDIQEHFKSTFRLLEIDIESSEPLTTNKHKATSRLDFAKKHRVRLTPTIVFLNTQGDVVYRHVGMIVDPQEFIWLSEYVTSGQTRKQNFATFKMNKRRSSAL